MDSGRPAARPAGECRVSRAATAAHRGWGPSFRPGKWAEGYDTGRGRPVPRRHRGSPACHPDQHPVARPAAAGAEPSGGPVSDRGETRFAVTTVREEPDDQGSPDHLRLRRPAARCAVLGARCSATSWSRRLRASTPGMRSSTAWGCRRTSATAGRRRFPWTATARGSSSSRCPRARPRRTACTSTSGRRRGSRSDERMAALEAEAERLVALGATRVRRFEPGTELSAGFIVMNDPEGNEFCLD